MIRRPFATSVRARHLFITSAAMAIVVGAELVGAPGPALAQVPSPRIINTIAGTGVQGFSGDNGPATEAMLSNAWGLALDSSGNLYFADYSNNRIRKVSATTGIITTVAGNGAWGYSGDGGPATEAQLAYLGGVALDAAGNLYITDNGHSVVRKVTAATGIISTIAGTGEGGYNGDGIQATAAQLGGPMGVMIGVDGNLYIGEVYRVRKVDLATGVITTVAGNGDSAFTGDGGPATAAGLYGAYPLAMDGVGNLFIGTQTVVRKVDATTQFISTVAGTGDTQGFAGDGGPATQALLSWASGVAVDAIGNLYLVDQGNSRVRRVDATTGVITTVAGSDSGLPGDGGPASLGWMDTPYGVVSDFAGNLVISERARVRFVNSDVAPAMAANPNGQSVLVGDTAVFAGAVTGVPAPAMAWQFSSDGGLSFTDLVEAAPYTGVATPTLTITDAPFSLNGYLYRLRATNVWGESFSSPASLTVTKRMPIVTWATPAPILPGTALDAAQLNAAADVAGTFVYDPPAGTVLAAGSDYLLKATFTPDDWAAYSSAVNYVLLDVIGATGEGARFITTIAGTGTSGFSGDGGPATAAQLYNPQAATLDGAGHLYIPDTTNHRVRKIDLATGVITTVAGTGVAGYNGDGVAATAAQLNMPVALAFDGAGNLYVSDMSNRRVRRIDAATGLISTVAGTGAYGFGGDDGLATEAVLQDPHGLAFDAAGNLFIADSTSSRVRKVNAATGIITTVAGGGYPAIGDGGPATEAYLDYVSAIRFDKAGNLYVAAYAQGRIRRVSAATGIISTVAGVGTWGSAGDGGPATAAQLANPVGFDFDDQGNLYIADSYNYRIRKVTAATGLISTIAGTGTLGFGGDGGPAAAAQFRSPGGVTVGEGGMLYVADTGNNRIRMIAEAAPAAFAPQPVNKSTDVGGAVVFAAGVSGFPLPVLQWQVSSNGTTWADLTNTAPYSGVTTPSLTITGATTDLNGLQYHLVATNSIGSATSNAAALTVVTTVKETPVITWSNPADVIYGTLLGATQLNATANVSGMFAYTPAAGALLQAGARTLSVLFTPDDGAHYTTATAEVTLMVLQATPVITWADPGSIVYGTALGAMQLNATASVPGAFVYKPAAGTVLNAGTQPLAVLFTPADAVNYSTATAGANILVTQATPVIMWPAPAGIVYGTPLGAAQLNATASTAGTFDYSQPAGTILGAGSHSLVADFTPTDTANFTTATANVQLTVFQATPTITWASPAPILHLTPLGAAQLNATANVAGSFVYFPAEGTVLGIGAAQELRAYFTPSDAINYASMTKTTTIDVNPFGPVITAFAGTGTAGFSGDGGAALAAEFQSPGPLAVDPAGNVFVSDLYNYRVRKIATGTGTVSTVAGSGDVAPADGGYGGDGGPATAARFWWVQGLAVDGAGNLFMADSANDRVRKVTAATGVVTTVAGDGIDGSSGDGGPATLARLGYASGAALDGAGDLYFADSNNSRIRKVSAATGIITTVAGDGTVGFSGDGGPATAARLYQASNVTVDLAGNLYIVDYVNQRIRKVTAATGIITTIAGNGVGDFTGDGGPATQASLNTPNSVAVDGAGNVYIMDAGNYRVRKIDAATGIITTVAGTGVYNSGAVGDGEEATLAGLGVVSAIALDAAGSLYLAGSDSNRIRKITALGAPSFWLTIAPAPVHGVVAGGGINCGSAATACQAGFASATTVTLTATPDADYLFQGWGGACAGSDASTTVDVGMATACSATFVPAAPPDGPPYTLTVTPPTGGKIEGAGINCGAGGTACSVTMPASMTLGIGATASAGYTFTAWTGDCAGTVPAQWVALNGPRTCGALFTPTGGTPDYQLTIAPAPTGGTVTGSGLACGAGGTTCQVAFGGVTTVSLTATPSSGYAFASWDGACSGLNSSTTVSVNAAVTCTATFTATGGGPVNGPPYTLSISLPTGGKVQGAGLNCGAGGAACSVTMPASMTLGIGATPSAGYTFSGWTGDCSGANPELWVALNGPRTCGAIFTPAGGSATYQLTIAPTPAGGTVTGNGLTCGTSGSTCVIAFGGATAASLTATPASGYAFTAWGGACSGTDAGTTVQVDAAITCTAIFTATGGPVNGPPYALTITSPTGGKIEGAGINCGAGGTACSVTMPAAMTLGMTATASAGYTFTAWTGDCTGTSPSQWVTLNGPRTCGATFTPVGGGGGGGGGEPPTGPPYTLTITMPAGGKIQGAGIDCGAGGTACSVTMPASMTLGIGATPSAGYVFGGWTGDCSGTNPNLWVALNGPRTCGATFTPSGG